MQIWAVLSFIIRFLFYNPIMFLHIRGILSVVHEMWIMLFYRLN